MEVQNNLKEVELDLKKRELLLREEELKVKNWEARNHAAEMHNTYMRETRGRADGLVKGVLLISGGALTLSLNAFLREHAIQIPTASISVLVYAWELLFTSMVSAILVPVSLIVGARFHSERWRRHLDEGKPGEKLEQPFWSDLVAWVFGVAGIAGCCGGLGLLASIAIEALKW